MKFHHTKHEIEQFACDLKILGKMIDMSDEHILEHFKESFPPKLELQLLEIHNINMR